MDKQNAGPGATNQYARFVEECGGMHTIHNLQTHDNMEIYKKSFNIMDKYFADEEEVSTIAATNVDASGNFAGKKGSIQTKGCRSLIDPILASSKMSQFLKAGSASDSSSFVGCNVDRCAIRYETVGAV